MPLNSVPLNRRQLLRTTAAGAGLIVVGDLTGLSSRAAAAAAHPAGRSTFQGGRVTRVHALTGTYGALVPDPQKLLDLPAGFSYRIISEAGKPTTDGGIVPDRFDGTGLFTKGTSTYLVRNSEQAVEED